MNKIEILQNNKYVKLISKGNIISVSYYNIKKVEILEEEIAIETYTSLCYIDSYASLDSSIYISFCMDSTVYEDEESLNWIVIIPITEKEFNATVDKIASTLKYTKKQLNGI